jgi:hypothetical protein
VKRQRYIYIYIYAVDPHAIFLWMLRGGGNTDYLRQLTLEDSEQAGANMVNTSH